MLWIIKNHIRFLESFPFYLCYYILSAMYGIFQYDLSPSSLGLVFLLLSTTYAVLSPLVGMIADRIVRITVSSPNQTYTIILNIYVLDYFPNIVQIFLWEGYINLGWYIFSLHTCTLVYLSGFIGFNTDCVFILEWKW